MGKEMKRNLTEAQIMATPIANGAGVFFCPDPNCHNPHLILLDDDGEPMAHFVIGPEFYAELQAAMAQKTGVEIDWPTRRFVLYSEIEGMYLDAVKASQIHPKINLLRDPLAMARALDKIGVIQLASK